MFATVTEGKLGHICACECVVI